MAHSSPLPGPLPGSVTRVNNNTKLRSTAADQLEAKLRRESSVGSSSSQRVALDKFEERLLQKAMNESISSSSSQQQQQQQQRRLGNTDAQRGSQQLLRSSMPPSTIANSGARRRIVTSSRLHSSEKNVVRINSINNEVETPSSNNSHRQWSKSVNDGASSSPRKSCRSIQSHDEEAIARLEERIRAKIEQESSPKSVKSTVSRESLNRPEGATRYLETGMPNLETGMSKLSTSQKSIDQECSSPKSVKSTVSRESLNRSERATRYLESGMPKLSSPQKSRRAILTEKLERKKSEQSVDAESLVAAHVTDKKVEGNPSLRSSKRSLDEKIKLKKMLSEKHNMSASVTSTTSVASNNSHLNQSNTTLESWENLRGALEYAECTSSRDVYKSTSSIFGRGGERVGSGDTKEKDSRRTFQSRSRRNKVQPAPSSSKTSQRNVSMASSQRRSNRATTTSSSIVVDTWDDLEDVLRRIEAESMRTLPRY